MLERLVTVYSGPTVNINLSYKFRRSELGRAFNKDRIFLTRITETNVGFSKQYTMTTPRFVLQKAITRRVIWDSKTKFFNHF